MIIVRPPVIPASMGMTLATDYTIPQNTRSDVAGNWVPRTGYPLTEIVGGYKLRANASMRVTVFALAKFSSLTAQAYYLSLNGFEFSGTITAGSSYTTTLDLTEGDEMWMRGQSAYASGAGRTFTSGEANTYLYWNLV